MQESFSLEDIFNVMIELETLGNKHYKEMEKLTDDYALKELFRQLAIQEMKHKELYTSYKDMNLSFKASGVTEEYKEYIEALLKGTIRFLKENSEIKDFKQGHERAINLEKDTILFLGEIKKILGQAYHEVIDNVMDQERGHLKALYSLKKQDI